MQAQDDRVRREFRTQRDWLQTLADWVGPRRSVLALNIFPPWVGAGIRVVEVSPTVERVVTQMKLSARNRNMFGTHFGGSLYSMCDPIFALMLHLKLGHEYLVWDKAADIQFLTPGRGVVRATFELSNAEAERVRQQADRAEKVQPTYRVRVVDESGTPVAEIEKLLYVRRKPKRA
jgi:acyl-coenzyme A thioesterase PaaI-like protein